MTGTDMPSDFNDRSSEVASFFARQSKLLGAAALLLRDERGRLLLVKPTYKGVWHLPGGLLEADESPRQAAHREVYEEIGVRLRVGRLLTIDYKPATAERPACLQFVFDGGLVDTNQLAGITLADGEIEDWRLMDGADALAAVEAGGPSSRLANTLAALHGNLTVYLEDGQLV